MGEKNPYTESEITQGGTTVGGKIETQCERERKETQFYDLIFFPFRFPKSN